MLSEIYVEIIKSIIDNKKLDDYNYCSKIFEQISLDKIELTEIIASLRLDNIVSSLARTSRNKAVEYLEQERVLLNFKTETKSSKQVKVGDIITIRGKGRFEFKEISGNTKKGRFIIKVDKFVWFFSKTLAFTEKKGYNIKSIKLRVRAGTKIPLLNLVNSKSVKLSIF